MASNDRRSADSSSFYDERHVLVETPEHEVIDFEGSSPEEAEAKLHDFLAWAS